MIIFVHEMGHFLLAFLIGWKVEKVFILPFGGVTIFNDDINKPLKEEFLILIFGPLFQIIFTLIFSFNDEIVKYSIPLLMFNLLPIFPLDGSKLFNIIFNVFFPFKKSHLMTIYLSILIMIFLLICFDFNLILLLTLVFMLSKILDELKKHNSIFNRFLLERYIKNYKFKKKRYIKDVDVRLMKRDFSHYFYDGKRYRSERDILKKRFDFNSKS